MRKDVKRSLIMWPATATAIVALISGYSILHDYAQNIGPGTDYLAIATQPSFEFDAPSLTNVSLASRGEHGRRAMELPERVADVLGVTQGQRTAQTNGRGVNDARVNGNREPMIDGYPIEGMIMPPWGVVVNATPHRSSGIAKARAQAEVVQPESPSGDGEPGSVQPQRQPTDLAGMLDGIIELSAPLTRMPESNRSLAKPEFRRSESIERREPIRRERHLNESSSGQIRLKAPSIETSSIGRGPATGPVVDVAGPDLLELDDSDATPRKPIDDRRSTFRVTGWPTPHLLNRQLKDLAIMVANVNLTTVSDGDSDGALAASASNADVDRWIVETTETLRDLQSLDRLGDEEAVRHIGRLRRLANEGISEANKVSNRSIQIAWLQAAYAIGRRVAIWKPIWQLAGADAERSEPSRFAIAMKPDSYGSVHAAIDRIRAVLPESGDAAGWDRYLLLEQIDRAASSADRDMRREIAKRFVARLERRNLHPMHRKWLEQQEPIGELRAALGPWARGVVDYSELLSQIELLESAANDKATLAISSTIETLRFAGLVDADRLADSIDTHYRNANVRIAITETMLQRLVPEVPAQSMPVRTRVQGSQVHGQSEIDSELQVSLIPSADRWTMHLKTVGQVRTRATGVRGPVSVRTHGRSNFTATTPIQITPYGVQLGDSVASVSGRTQLRGIQTDYDGWPLVGTLVRAAAANRFDSMSSQSTRLANRKIASEIESRVDVQFHERLGEATEQMGQAVLGPLGRMKLDPLVTDMMTTEDRLVARYRLAGNSQLAAFTPRPRALGNSLVSVQVHQSAINNVLHNLIPTDRPTSIRAAIADAIAMFGDHEIEVPDDIPDDVTVQFARTNPITVEFKDDAMWLTMRIASLRRDRLNLTKFIVQAEFRPQVDGTLARLQREGHLRISGPGMSMRERLPIRAIFNKVLSSNRPLPLTVKAMSEHPVMDELTIGQLELRDGWIAMAIIESGSERMASSDDLLLE